MKRMIALALAALTALALTACRANGGVSVTASPSGRSEESTLGDPGRSVENDLENGRMTGEPGDGYVTNDLRNEGSLQSALPGGMA